MDKKSKEHLTIDSAWYKIAVLFAAILVHSLNNIFQLSFLRIYNDFIDKNTTTSLPDLSYVTTFSNVVIFIVCFLCGFVLRRENINKVALCSSLLSSIAYFIGSYSKNIDYFILSTSTLAGGGFSCLQLTSVITLSFTFSSWFPLMYALVVGGAKSLLFLWEPLMEIMIYKYQWDGVCQIFSALCLNGILCGLVFSFPNNIETLGLGWVFYCPDITVMDRSNDESYKEVEFKNNHVVRSLIRHKKKTKDESTKSLDGCIITDSNSLLRPPRIESYDEKDLLSIQTEKDSIISQAFLDNSNKSFFIFNSSSCISLESVFKEEPQKLEHNQCKKVAYNKIEVNLSNKHFSNYRKIFKKCSIFAFNLSYMFAHLGISLPSSLIFRKVIFDGFSGEFINLLYFLSMFFEIIFYFSIAFFLKIKKVKVSILYTTILISSSHILLLLVWFVNATSLIILIATVSFIKSTQTIILPTLLRTFGNEMFVQSYSLSHIFEAMAITLSFFITEGIKKQGLSFEKGIIVSYSLILIGGIISVVFVIMKKKENDAETFYKTQI